MIRVTLYTKKECELCDQARTDLAGLQTSVPHRLVEIDVESDPVLLARHGANVPVVETGPYTLRAPFTATDLKVALLAAQKGAEGKPALEGGARQRAVGRTRLVGGFARHWLAILNTIVFLYVAIPFLAPVLLKLGAEGPARIIYTAYSPVCHQLAFRSWFLFGEQAAYPRALAGTSLIPFGQATGIDENDLLAARAFVGNETLGFKVALCERDVAIYGGILLGGLIFAFVRGRLKPLPVWAWFLFGVLPMAIDGGTQLISGFPGLPAGWVARESTPLLRTVTGLLFGLMNVWLAYPYLEESMAETRATAKVRLAGSDPPPAGG
ncbi:MAG TPA: DUF2085 domain-containing protein [Anaerolineales bacterium]|nr:DUF2085 domain-containing protein [Anaerolineales bacterium]